MGISISEVKLNKIIEKAKSKKDGVWSMDGTAYRVRDKSVTHIAQYGGLGILSYGFLVNGGSFDFYKDPKAILRGIKTNKAQG